MSTQLGDVAVDVAFDYVDEADEMEGTLPVIKVSVCGPFSHAQLPPGGESRAQGWRACPLAQPARVAPPSPRQWSEVGLLNHVRGWDTPDIAHGAHRRV